MLTALDTMNCAQEMKRQREDPGGWAACSCWPVCVFCCSLPYSAITRRASFGRLAHPLIPIEKDVGLRHCLRPSSPPFYISAFLLPVD